MENIKDYLQYLKGFDYTGETPVVIDFFATWCGPCQYMSPLIQKLAEEFEGKIKVLKVDVDKNQALAEAARIMSIPTFFFISRDGSISRNVGGMPYEQLKSRAEQLLG